MLGFFHLISFLCIVTYMYISNIYCSVSFDSECVANIGVVCQDTETNSKEE